MRASRLARLGGAVSQFFNVLIFNGDENYSVSTDAHRLGRTTLARRIDWIAAKLGDPDHCRNSHQHDLSQAGKLLAEADFRRAAALIKEVEK